MIFNLFRRHRADPELLARLDHLERGQKTLTAVIIAHFERSNEMQAALQAKFDDLNAKVDQLISIAQTANDDAEVGAALDAVTAKVEGALPAPAAPEAVPAPEEQPQG